MTKSFPYPNSNLNIGITNKSSADTDWAPGSYHLPNANICVANAQGDVEVTDAGYLFGFLGQVVATNVIAGGVKNSVQGKETNLSLALASITQQCLGEALAQSKTPSRFSFDQNWSESPVQITPYAVLSFVDADKARLWMVLRVEWVDNNVNQHNNWACRYIVGLGDPRPITGQNGWAANQGKYFEEMVRYDTRMAVQVMLDDLDGKLRKDQATLENMAGCWMFYKDPHMAKVQILKSSKDWDIVLPQVDDVEYFAGVNILPKNFAFLQSIPEN